MAVLFCSKRTSPYCLRRVTTQPFGSSAMRLFVCRNCFDMVTPSPPKEKEKIETILRRMTSRKEN